MRQRIKRTTLETSTNKLRYIISKRLVIEVIFNNFYNEKISEKCIGIK